MNLRKCYSFIFTRNPYLNEEIPYVFNKKPNRFASRTVFRSRDALRMDEGVGGDPLRGSPPPPTGKVLACPSPSSKPQQYDETATCRGPKNEDLGRGAR